MVPSAAVTEATLPSAVDWAVEAAESASVAFSSAVRAVARAVAESAVAVEIASWTLIQSVAVSVGNEVSFDAVPAECAWAVVPSKPRVSNVMTPVIGFSDVQRIVSSLTVPQSTLIQNGPEVPRGWSVGAPVESTSTQSVRSWNVAVMATAENPVAM
jgi:hypothetical protein